MDFYKELLKLNDEEIDILVDYRVECLENDKEVDYIGYNAENNFIKHDVVENNNERSYSLDMRCFHGGFIPKNTKVIYGMIYSFDGKVSNEGNYYYIDSHKYIKDFCKYIKNYDIANEYELLDYILDYLKEYFGSIEKISREDMFKLIRDENNHNYNLINEHSLSQFKGKGNALCSEYSIMAQNILSFFGITSYLVIGKIKTGDFDEEAHAFNLISINNNDYLIDFSNYVRVLDINFKYLGKSPFIGRIDILDQEFVDALINEEEVLEFDDYNYLVIGDTLAKISFDRKRKYYIDGQLDFGKTKKKCK